MRPIKKSIRKDSSGNPLSFKHWGDAKPELVIELGCFCSYCEMYNRRSALHVEHIYAKETKDIHGNLKYDHLKFRWDNFLLSCVNCNSVKGKKDIAVLNPYMPHQNNLLCYVEVLMGGIISIKNNVTGQDRHQTEAFIDLIGLDRVPGNPNYSSKDDRWDTRMKVYDTAKRYLNKYSNLTPTTDIETIVDLSFRYGCFLIWFTVFEKHEEVIEALINGIIDSDGNPKIPFPGIDKESFDNKNHFIPLPRP